MSVPARGGLGKPRAARMHGMLAGRRERRRGGIKVISLFDELLEKASRESATSRGGARTDIGMLLFSRRAEIAALWKAAEAAGGIAEDAKLRAAVEALRPLFGER